MERNKGVFAPPIPTSRLKAKEYKTLYSPAVIGV